jgi:hypothetical protein
MVLNKMFKAIDAFRIFMTIKDGFSEEKSNRFLGTNFAIL